MRCKLTNELIEKFYSSEITEDLSKHIIECFECKKTFEVIEALNSFELRFKPNSSVDNYILSYADERIKSLRIGMYVKRLSWSFLLSVAVFMLVFISKFEYFTDEKIDNRLYYLEEETKRFLYLFDEDDLFSF